MIVRDLIIFTFLFAFSVQLSASDLVFTNRVATALHPLTVHTDSSFSKATQQLIREGELLTVIGETVREHEDDAQNQTFKWYQIRQSDGQIGWVFGDGLAVILADDQVEPMLKSYHKSRHQFSSGFEKGVIWVAAIEGRDNFHKQAYLNPIYKEQYLVITNDRGRSVHINYAGLSTQGENTIGDFTIQDITGDNIAEIILTRIGKSTGSLRENRTLEVFSFQAGTLHSVLDEYLNLNYSDGLPAPSLYKQVEIDKGSIRISYVDYLPCKDYQLAYQYDPKGETKERCMEYVTYTYLWSERDKTYQLFYEPTHTYPRAGVKQTGHFLRKAPNTNAAKVAAVKKTDLLRVVKHYEEYLREENVKMVRNYLYVQLPSGQYGYLPAEAVGFIHTEHATILNTYYANPPLSKTDWRSDEPFLKVQIPRQDAVSSGK
ncbi:MAG: SH3 domain-containing protein [Bacteroidota bacterium]